MVLYKGMVLVSHPDSRASSHGGKRHGAVLCGVNSTFRLRIVKALSRHRFAKPHNTPVR